MFDLKLEKMVDYYRIWLKDTIIGYAEMDAEWQITLLNKTSISLYLEIFYLLGNEKDMLRREKCLQSLDVSLQLPQS